MSSSAKATSRKVAHIVQEENRMATAMPADVGARTKAMKIGRVCRAWRIQIFVAGRCANTNAANVTTMLKTASSQSVSPVKENFATNAEGSKIKAVNNTPAQTETAPLNLALE